MLNLIHDEEVVYPVTEGSTFRLPNGDTVSPAYSGWDNGVYRLEDAPAPPAPTPEEVLQERRRSMRLSFAQLMIGLVAENWMSEADARLWLTGTLPSMVQVAIALLPVEHQFAATARASRPSEIVRTDPLVELMAMSQGKTAEDVDTFFLLHANS